MYLLLSKRSPLGNEYFIFEEEEFNCPELMTDYSINDQFNKIINSCIIEHYHYTFICLNHQGDSASFTPIHFTLRSYSHSPSFMLSEFTIYFPRPCLLSFFHSPTCLRPSIQVYYPVPCFLSFLYDPSYFLPSFQVYTPWPCFLLSSHYPTYFLPSVQVHVP